MRWMMSTILPFPSHHQRIDAGMTGKDPGPDSLLHPVRSASARGAVVFDMVYAPLETALRTRRGSAASNVEGWPAGRPGAADSTAFRSSGTTQHERRARALLSHESCSASRLDPAWESDRDACSRRRASGVRRRCGSSSVAGAGAARVEAIERRFPGTTGESGVDRTSLAEERFGRERCDPGARGARASARRRGAPLLPARACRQAMVVMDIPLLLEKGGAPASTRSAWFRAPSAAATRPSSDQA